MSGRETVEVKCANGHGSFETDFLTSVAVRPRNLRSEAEARVFPGGTDPRQPLSGLRRASVTPRGSANACRKQQNVMVCSALDNDAQQPHVL